MNPYFLLVLGLVCAGGGGELFIRGAVGLAHWARIPAGIIGATIAAFATSSPELSVGLSAAIQHRPTLSFGDAVGSNVVNIGAILAIALLLSPTHVPRESLKRDFPVALLVPIVTALLALDGQLSRLDGVLLLLFFLVWFTATVVEARKQRDLTEEIMGAKPAAASLYALLGLGLLLVSAGLIVSSAVAIAQSFGIQPFVIGATVVAIGTSMPELAITVMAKVRGQQEIALGTILGSNIFNGLFIVGLVATLSPIPVVWNQVLAGLVIGSLLVALTFPPRSGLLDRRRGALLLALYLVYLTVMLQGRPG